MTHFKPPLPHSPTLSTAPANGSGFCPMRLQRLSAVLQAEVDRQRLPGAVALIARHGQTVMFESLGQQDPAAGTPMQPGSIFRIYSMTKPIVSVAAMMLAEQGRLLLNDPVSKYLPEFAAQQVCHRVEGHVKLQPVRRGATVQDLLRHTAGLTYEFLGSAPVQRQYAQTRIGSRERNNAELSAALAGLPLVAEPGTVWEYSRATDVLGRIIEVISGQTLGQFLQSQVFEPLGMHETWFNVPPKQRHRVAEPFARDPDGGMQMRVYNLDEPCNLESGGGGLLCTTADYARFLQFMLNQGELDGTRLLGPRTVAYMTADHLGQIPINGGGARDLLPMGYGFGLGFAVRQSVGIAPAPGSAGTYYWGGLGGTTFFVDPVQDLFAILMVQAPNQREHYRMLFANLVYAALID